MRPSLFSVRLAIFWIWVATLGVSLALFLTKGDRLKMETPEVLNHAALIVALLGPQIALMLGFMFRDTDKTRKTIEENPHLATLAMVTSVLYHAAFWFFLWYGIMWEKLGPDMGANTASIVKLMGFISFLGLAPVGFLFAAKSKEEAKA